MPQFPLVQIAATLLRVQCPLLGFQQIGERERQHFVGQAVFFTDTETIVAIYDDYVLVDNNGGVTTVFQDIALQSRKLLSA